MRNKSYYSPRKRKKIRKIKIGLALILIGIILCFITTDRALRPIIQRYSVNKAELLASDIINKAVYGVLEKNHIAYDDIVKLSVQEDKTVTSIETDIVKVNLLKTEIINEIQNAFKESPDIEIAIPIGTLTGNDYFIGRGPSIKINMKVSTAVLSEIVSHFEDAGINQTIHTLNLYVKAKVYIMMPWYKANTEVNNNFSIAETVIVGKVPDAFTNVVHGDDKLVGDLFDFGPEDNTID